MTRRGIHDLLPTHGWQANESVLSEACPSLCLSVYSVCLSAEIVHCGKTVQDGLMASRKHICNPLTNLTLKKKI